jgi:flavorubredoxin
MADILTYIKGLKPKNLIGAAFGSYGWSGECVKVIEEHLGRCKIPVAAPGVRAKWQPKPPDLAECEKLGRQVAQALKSK